MNNISTRILASICAVCPFCIMARQWPSSGYARALRKFEKSCPACRAYAKQKQMSATGNHVSQ
ncbi:MAG: hypothetical protein A2283_18570 [Lentisphaerae bacterium RIFOXYA12_FULL_48_11]|nr:MAG: hypothetical protein A2283_18570 [Lentisphaerae bacterium RIFOXYA12_FULL_48_11]